MRSGHVFRQVLWEPATSVIGGGLLPTPTTITPHQNSNSRAGNGSPLLQMSVEMGLLPTPQARDHKRPSKPDSPRMQRKQEQGWSPSLEEALMLLPTPKASDGERGRDKARARPDTKSRELATTVRDRMLPTPTVNDSKNSTLPPSQIDRDGLAGAMLRDDSIPTGEATYLNPSFVEEMMGFPVGWTA